MKPIWKVFLIIGILVGAFLIWALVFNDGGILQTGWNSVANNVNGVYQTVVGDSSAKILPNWADANVDTDTDLGGANQ